MKLTFAHVKDFCCKWGLVSIYFSPTPQNSRFGSDRTYQEKFGFNPIPDRREEILKSAKQWGPLFCDFMSKMTDSKDGWMFICARDWDKFKDEFVTFFPDDSNDF
jgi:hypothetical protein